MWREQVPGRHLITTTTTIIIIIIIIITIIIIIIIIMWREQVPGRHGDGGVRCLVRSLGEDVRRPVGENGLPDPFRIPKFLRAVPVPGPHGTARSIVNPQCRPAC